MEIFIHLAIPALIPIILGIVLSNIDKNNGKGTIKNLAKEHIIVRLPKAYLWIGCLDIAFFTPCILLMACYPNGTEATWVWLLFVLLAFLGIVIVLETQLWKIEIFRHENYFLCRAMPYKTYKILYSDCLSYRFGTNTLVLRTKERTFHIDTRTTNFEFFLSMLTQHKINEIK